MVKTIRNGLIFAAAVHFLLFTVQIISGYVMTMLYVPDIISTYESVEVHHRTVSFGTAVKVPGWAYMITFIGCVLLYAFLIKPALHHWKQRRIRQ
ncbi:hypothetical protein PN4B1_05060 [Paenibacillus naphthalenovorans]|uniref:hypothetical protein n=1 Tax=Paenibacillus naphthalenovorans TaxID=162209 RepID=UPI0010B9ADC8|nr:hypothetical protein [Paenibacillus naphthalenovorans]GCL70604.1 hypothetical protein PN4B1_05060 [Paenibacillus naphthalenovorans]